MGDAKGRNITRILSYYMEDATLQKQNVPMMKLSQSPKATVVSTEKTSVWLPILTTL